MTNAGAPFSHGSKGYLWFGKCEKYCCPVGERPTALRLRAGSCSMLRKPESSSYNHSLVTNFNHWLSDDFDWFWCRMFGDWPPTWPPRSGVEALPNFYPNRLRTFVNRQPVVGRHQKRYGVGDCFASHPVAVHA